MFLFMKYLNSDVKKLDCYIRLIFVPKMYKIFISRKFEKEKKLASRSCNTKKKSLY